MARNRHRNSEAKESVELPEEVTLYPDPHYYVEGVPQDVITVSRERAKELLAYGRRDEKGNPAWDGELVGSAAFHLEKQTAAFTDQLGEEAAMFEDPPEAAEVAEDDEDAAKAAVEAQVDEALHGPQDDEDQDDENE